jgi:hypothetical protein
MVEHLALNQTTQVRFLQGTHSRTHVPMLVKVVGYKRLSWRSRRGTVNPLPSGKDSSTLSRRTRHVLMLYSGLGKWYPAWLITKSNQFDSDARYKENKFAKRGSVAPGRFEIRFSALGNVCE